jgi:LPXTG-motif cell wall-anchored protein
MAAPQPAPEKQRPPAGSGAVAARSQEGATGQEGASPLWLFLAGGVVTVGLAGWLVRRHRRANA